MKLSTERKVILGFGAGLVILLVVGAVSYRAIYELVRAAELRHHVERVIAGLKDVLSGLDRAESEQRGYVITGEEAYLSPFQTAVGGVAERLTRLRQLAADEPRVQQQLDTLQPLIDDRVARLSKGIELRRQSGFEAAVASVRTGVGRRLMNDIHRLINEMSGDQRRLLTQREAAVRRQTKWTVFAILLGSVLSVAIVVFSIIIIRSELTARQQAEEALRASEERFRALVQHSNDIASVIDSSGTIRYISPSVERILGYRPGDMIGHNAFEYVHSDDIGPLRDGFVASLGQSAATAPRVEYRQRHANGSWVYVETTGTSLFEIPGIRGTLLTTRDIRDRKELEQQRADFLAMLTHDIKNPLSVIMGSLELLRAKGLLRAEESLESLSRMESSAETILDLVTNYLDLSKIEAGQMSLTKTTLALDELLGEVVRQYGLEARRRGIALTLRQDRALSTVEGDAVALERVFANLVYNALKFTPEGGRIEIVSRRDGEGLAVAVSDTGPGIAADELPTLFQRYRQTRSGRVIGGTGMGLFIVKWLVEAHGGTVRVESTVGQGTCFEVHLPIGPGTGKLSGDSSAVKNAAPARRAATC